MKKVLQLCHKPPFPSVDGGCMEMAKMSAFFNNSNAFHLDILTYGTQKHPFNAKYFSHLTNSKVYGVSINTRLTKTGAVKGLVRNKSYHLSRFKSESFKAILTELVNQNNYDYIVLESIFAGLYLDDIKQLTTAKIILNSPNVEFEIWERIAQSTSNTLKKLYLKKLAKQLKKEELAITSKVDGIIAISKKDEAFYHNQFPKKTITNIPYLLDTKRYKKEEGSDKNEFKLYHIGAMDWQPNLTGVEWFLHEVWQKNEASFHNISLSLAGKNMPTVFNKYANKNTFVHGFVDNAIDFHKQHTVMVVPLFSGSGMRIKLIEAMACGNCIITTAIGAEGIPYEHNKHLIIANTPQEFKEAILLLLNNREQIQKIGKNAQHLVQEHFDNCILEAKITHFFKQL